MLDMDRSGLNPFGFVSLSAHMTGLVRDGNDTKSWMPKRLAAKSTVSNNLDSIMWGLFNQGAAC